RLGVLTFIIVLIMGICLHIATNVYNDIYDTKQGTDKLNVNRNEFSGGSGVLVDHPDLFPKMYSLARLGLIGALLTTIVLYFIINDRLQIHLILLLLLSVFFSKYYTAAPVKLAYRGWGEFFVWLAFGPMAILVAAVSQNVGFHKIICVAMPITGISTLSILLIGQMIDHDADKATGKWGVAARLGNRTKSYIYMIVQIVLCLNIVILSIIYLKNGWPVLISLIPYIILIPKILKIIIPNYNHPELLKTAARLNVFLHLLFSLLFSLSLILTIAL
ncbi:MAG: prenyltransferase, partial [Cyclobacteriaceae bacterium]|nr:prenyltransferase [Cyclobacteriaceae bacterium]